MIIRSVEAEDNFLLNGMVKTRSHMIQNMVYIRFYRIISKNGKNWMIPTCSLDGFELPRPGLEQFY